MSRSIHSTINKYRREARFRYANEETHGDRLAAINAEIERKRLVKAYARSERSSNSIDDVPAITAEMIPIYVIEQSSHIHYPASPADIRAVLERLPTGLIVGIAGIRLCLGGPLQEEVSAAQEGVEALRDPWTGRIGEEILPEVFCGIWLGAYSVEPAFIDLHAYVYERALPEREIFYLRLRMLSSLVHEVAHHEDFMQRGARARMRKSDKLERYAITTQALWVRNYVVPYLEETYPEEVRELGQWIENHGGAPVSLALLAGNWRWNDNDKLVGIYFGSARHAYEGLASDVYYGGDLTMTRIIFARELSVGENYNLALAILDRVLEEQPQNIEAMTLLADIFEHQKKYEKAEAMARRVVDSDPNCLDAWMVLDGVYNEQKNWPRVLAAATAGMAVPDGSAAFRDLLKSSRIRANLALNNLKDARTELDELPSSFSCPRLADLLRAELWQLENPSDGALP